MAEVLAVIRRGDTRWVFLDAGVFTGLVETLDEAIRYPIETDRDGGPTGPCVVAGPTCDSTDVLYERAMVDLPLDLSRGRHRAPARGRRLHHLLLDGRLQRLPAAADAPGLVSPRVAVARQLASYAAASVAMSLPWPLLLVLAWDRYGDGPHGPLVIGLVGAARMVPYVLLSWAVGSLGDRIRRERLLAATLVLRLVFLGVVAVAVSADRLALAVVAAALAIACGTPAYPTVAAAMPRLAGPAKRRATEVLVTIEVAAWVVGPALGGLLLLPVTRPYIPLIAVALTVRRGRAGLAGAAPRAGDRPAYPGRGGEHVPHGPRTPRPSWWPWPPPD